MLTGLPPRYPAIRRIPLHDNLPELSFTDKRLAITTDEEWQEVSLPHDGMRIVHVLDLHVLLHTPLWSHSFVHYC